MNRKMSWGIAALIIILIAAGGFIYWQWSQVQQLKDELADAKKLEKHLTQQPAADNKPPRPAQDGFKWEWHGDHWHEMPVAQNDAPRQTPIEQPIQAKKTYTGPLTYHEELLKTNPVEALRLQAEERGHWSAKWVPPFPPDDQEAAAIARDLYLITYYESINDTTNPICQKALRNNEARIVADSEKNRELAVQVDTFTYKDRVPPSEEYKQFKWKLARISDLSRLSWVRTTEGGIIDPARFASKTLLPK